MFGDVLATRSGRLVQLMLCANVARAFKRTGRKGPLTDTMTTIAADLLTTLK